jgi:hypothetical protein
MKGTIFLARNIGYVLHISMKLRPILMLVLEALGQPIAINKNQARDSNAVRPTRKNNAEFVGTIYTIYKYIKKHETCNIVNCYFLLAEYSP